MLRLQARIAVNGISENRIEAGSEPFKQRRRAIAAAHVRAQLGSGLAEKIRNGGVAGVGGRGRRKRDSLIGSRRQRDEHRAIQREELRPERARNLQAIAEKLRLVLRENSCGSVA